MTGNGTHEEDTEREWWAENGEVLRRKKDGELYHVLGRLLDVDTGQQKYEIDDDTHTTKEYWYAEDVRDSFKKTGTVVLHGRKPILVLDGRLYENDHSIFD